MSLSLPNTSSFTGVDYNGRVLKWDTVIEQKATELNWFLVGKLKSLSFAKPTLELKRYDNRETRNRILELTQESARELGIGKSTLHYLRRNCMSDDRFTIYRKVRKKL